MIRFRRTSPPAELDSATAAKLTKQFEDTGDSVWNQAYIRNSLNAMSSGKCAYCECSVDEESKYMEVEHFYAKVYYPKKVVEWDNLLPSCKRCNGNKSSHDVIADGMIIDPTKVDPTLHLKLKNYRMRGIDDLGRRTIEATHLNDSDRLVSVRWAVGESVLDKLDDIRVLVQTHLDGARTKRQINRAIRTLDDLFTLALPCKEYSSTVASILLSDDDYDWIKLELIGLGLWSSFAPKEAMAQSSCLA